MRRLTENPYVQIAFHVAGGLGLGLLVAPLLQQKSSVALGVLLLSASILGHWYAVLRDQRDKSS